MNRSNWASEHVSGAGAAAGAAAGRPGGPPRPLTMAVRERRPHGRATRRELRVCARGRQRCSALNTPTTAESSPEPTPTPLPAGRSHTQHQRDDDVIKFMNKSTAPNSKSNRRLERNRWHQP